MSLRIDRRRNWPLAWALAVLAVCASTSIICAAPPAREARPRVSFEVVTQPGLPPATTQQWYKALSGLGVSGLQIRSASASDEMAISERAGKGSKEFRVIGVLSADNVLSVPGGKFKLTDMARLRKWIDKLGDNGAEGVTQPIVAFGLIARELDEVNEDLKRPVQVSTVGLPAAKAMDQIGRRLKYSLELDAGTAAALGEVKIAEELRGLSSGTALAVALRPAGLVFEPQRTKGGQISYRVRTSQAGREAWPIGWKPKQANQEILPEMFEFLNVEIASVPLSEALAAIETRLKIPFLYDHNAIAHYGIDLKRPAVLPDTRLAYSQILNRVLAQAKLKYELRVDEADRPFLWITSDKPLK